MNRTGAQTTTTGAGNSGTFGAVTVTSSGVCVQACNWTKQTKQDPCSVLSWELSSLVQLGLRKQWDAWSRSQFGWADKVYARSRPEMRPSERAFGSAQFGLLRDSNIWWDASPIWPILWYGKVVWWVRDLNWIGSDRSQATDLNWTRNKSTRQDKNR